MALNRSPPVPRQPVLAPMSAQFSRFLQFEQEFDVGLILGPIGR
jgi:hypothetical protein